MTAHMGSNSVKEVLENSDGIHFYGHNVDDGKPGNPSLQATSETENGNREPFIIGVAGGAASGKTTVCNMIIQQLCNQRAALVNQDSFYYDLTEEKKNHVHEYNFDHPDAFDIEHLLYCMEKLRHGQAVDVPNYDFRTYEKILPSRKVNTSDVIILEGILVFHDPRVREMMNIKIFVDTDADVRLARWIKRDTLEKGRDIKTALDQEDSKEVKHS